MGGLSHHFSWWIFRIQNCIQNMLGLFYGETLFFEFVFAGLAVGEGSGQVPHAGVPEIVTCPLPPPTDCGEQFFR
jgi:hypothetical protein